MIRGKQLTYRRANPMKLKVNELNESGAGFVNVSDSAARDKLCMWTPSSYSRQEAEWWVGGYDGGVLSGFALLCFDFRLSNICHTVLS